jgi:hypothetical protein
MKRFVVLALALLLAGLAWYLARVDPERAPVEPAPAAGASSPRVEPKVDGPGASTEREIVARAPEAPPAPTPEPAAHATGDPTEEELQAFAREVPPNTVEGIVLRGTKPVAGGKAWLGRDPEGGVRWDQAESWDTAPNVLRAEIGADGIFRFTDVEAETWALRVRTKDGASRWMWLDVHAESGSQRIRIVLGTAAIHGHVFDENGAPGADWRVIAYIFGPTPGGVQQIQDEVTTGADGSYAFAGLTGGSYIVAAHPAAEFRDPRRREQRVQLAPGEQKVVDFGASVGGVWSGRLTTPRGEPLDLENMPQLEIDTNGSSEFLTLSEGGRWSRRIAAGTHQASLWQFEGVRTPLGEITTGDQDLERDLAVPRCLVRVRVTVREAPVPKWPKAALSLRLTGKGGAGHERTPWLGGSWVGLRAKDGNVYFIGIPPGEHVLRGDPMAIVGVPDGKMPVTIGAGDDQVEVDVVVSDG